MPLILPGNVASATAAVGYDVANSCRFNSVVVTYMDRTIESPTLGTKWTVSFWVKKDLNGDYHHILTSTANPGNWDSIRFDMYDNFQVLLYGLGVNLTTTAVYRDVSAWYHFVVACDTTQGVAANRLKLYVNGTQETSFSTETYPDQNLIVNYQVSGKTLRIGANAWDVSSGHEMLGGYLAEVFFIDGVAHAASDFGEFDEDSPTIWKPKDCSGDFTYGTNGFYLDFADSGDFGDDESGNGNDFSETGMEAIDQATDTPTNNFCTFNPLIPNTAITYSEGNLQVVSTSGGGYYAAVGTIGTQSGKWYCEMNASDGFVGGDKGCGIYRLDNAYGATTGLGNYTTGTTWSYSCSGYVRTNNATTDNEATFTDGDIIGIAMDLDNNKLYWAKNNTWINSGDPESGATGTGSYAIVAGDFYTFAVTVINDGAEDPVWQANFGSPMYANSSDAADENGYGAFEYAPPSGYYALCTKNLAEFG